MQNVVTYTESQNFLTIDQQRQFHQVKLRVLELQHPTKTSTSSNDTTSSSTQGDNPQISTNFAPLLAELSKIRNENEMLVSKVNNFEEENRRLSNDVKQQKRQNTSLQNELGSAKNTIDNNERVRKIAQSQISTERDEHQTNIKSLQFQIHEKDLQIKALNENLDSQIKLLKSHNNRLLNDLKERDGLIDLQKASIITKDTTINNSNQERERLLQNLNLLKENSLKIFDEDDQRAKRRRIDVINQFNTIV